MSSQDIKEVTSRGLGKASYLRKDGAWKLIKSLTGEVLLNKTTPQWEWQEPAPENCQKAFEKTMIEKKIDKC